MNEKIIDLYRMLSRVQEVNMQQADLIEKLQKKGEEWIELFKKMNSDRIVEIRDLQRRTHEIEKIKGLVSSSLDKTLCDIEKKIEEIGERLDKIEDFLANIWRGDGKFIGRKDNEPAQYKIIGLTFSEALEWLKKGYKITIWNIPEMFIYFNMDANRIDMNDTKEEWKPDTYQLLRNDWHVSGDEPCK